MDISRIRNVKFMFMDSIIETPLDLDLKKAKTLQGMFWSAEINAPLKIDAPSAVSMSEMFEMAEINQKITFSPQTRPADVFEMFADATIQASPDLDLKKAEDLTGMFRDASIYAPLNINAPSAESMSEMFMGANISAKITFSPETRPVNVRKIFEDAYVKVLPDISIATDYDLPAMYRTTKYVNCQTPKQNREAPEQNRGSSVEKRYVSDELKLFICIFAPTTCASVMSGGRH